MINQDTKEDGTGSATCHALKIYTFRVSSPTRKQDGHTSQAQTHNVKRNSLCSTGGIKVLFALAFEIFHKTVNSFGGGRFDQINHIVQGFVLLDLKLCLSFFGLLFDLVDEPCLSIKVSTQKLGRELKQVSNETI